MSALTATPLTLLKANRCRADLACVLRGRHFLRHGFFKSPVRNQNRKTASFAIYYLFAGVQYVVSVLFLPHRAVLTAFQLQNILPGSRPSPGVLVDSCLPSSSAAAFVNCGRLRPRLFCVVVAVRTHSVLRSTCHCLVRR